MTTKLYHGDCNHDDKKHHTYIDIFDPVGEIWMCECGALVDIWNQRNLRDDGDDTLHAMSADTLTRAVLATVLEAVRQAVGASQKATSGVRQYWEHRAEVDRD